VFASIFDDFSTCLPDEADGRGAIDAGGRIRRDLRRDLVTIPDAPAGAVSATTSCSIFFASIGLST
jgi:hypothetical protein